MKAELTLPENLVDQIVSRVVEQLKPMICGNASGEDELLTVKEAATFLKTSKEQIYQWVNNSQHGLGTFPYLKAGKLLRFSKTAILNWLTLRNSQ